MVTFAHNQEPDSGECIPSEISMGFSFSEEFMPDFRDVRSMQGCPCFLSAHYNKSIFITQGLVLLPVSTSNFRISFTSQESLPFLSDGESELLLPGTPPSFTRNNVSSQLHGFEVTGTGAENIWTDIRKHELNPQGHLASAFCERSDREMNVFLWWPRELDGEVSPIVQRFTKQNAVVSCKGGTCRGIHIPCLTIPQIQELYALCLDVLEKELVKIVWDYVGIGWAVSDNVLK